MKNTETHSYDLIVLGSGPAGEKAAVKAAYFGYRVALVEKSPEFGGAGVQTGTIPSKTLKETALYLSGTYEKGVFGIDREFGRKAGVEDFLYRKDLVIREMNQTVSGNLRLHGVDIYHGFGSFRDPNHIAVRGEREEWILRGEYVLIATGSYPYRPDHIPFDGIRIHDSDTILGLKRFPESLCVLGAGVIGCEYTTIFGASGVATTLVNDRDKILGFLDDDLSEALVEQMKQRGIRIEFNNSVTHIDVPADEGRPLEIHLKDGRVIEQDMFLFAAGRSGNIRGLGCEEIGLETGKRETVLVDEKYRTNIPNIYAVGDVIGFPALASTSMEQGRVAVTHMFGTGDLEAHARLFPYGIYTVPEVSMIGITEQEALSGGIDVLKGISYYRNTSRGKIMGIADGGFLKLVVDRPSQTILGVHIIGKMATELIHYGMELVRDEKTLSHLLATVFNYPTFHSLYKYAAYDALGNLSGNKVKE